LGDGFELNIRRFALELVVVALDGLELDERETERAGFAEGDELIVVEIAEGNGRELEAARRGGVDLVDFERTDDDLPDGVVGEQFGCS